MAQDRSTLSRLAAVAALVPQGARVADIGTDAALLPRRLVASGRASFCVAIDSSAAAIRAARAASAGAGPRLAVRAGAGLAAIDPRDGIDTVVLSGLGARSIVRILDDPRRAALEPLRLVLQPQTEPQLLRSWLDAQGFAVVGQAQAIERGRLYVVLAAERSTVSRRPAERAGDRRGVPAPHGDIARRPRSILVGRYRRPT